MDVHTFSLSAALAGLLLCAAPGRAQRPPAPESLPGTSAELLRLARTVERATATVRGLRVKRPVAMGVLSREEILKRVEQKIAREYTAEEIAADSTVLKLLGLLPADLDYRQAVLALLKEQVAGFYDPVERKLNLASWTPMALQEPALAHEICHALQDQHFGLKSFVKPLKSNGDQQLARAALVEGDCTGVMLEYLLRGQGLDLGAMPESVLRSARSVMASADSSALGAAPAFLRETLVFPYLQGLELMRSVRAKHGWDRVNAMYKRPPESTEQILHPAKYWSRERPVAISKRPLPALAGHLLFKEDVLGELQLSLLLAQGVDSGTAERAAAGWGGDALSAFRRKPEDPALLVHLSAWDSEADATEFTNALRHALVKRGLDVSTQGTKDGALWVYVEKDGGEWSVERRGAHVLLLAAVPAEPRVRLQQEVWQKWRVVGGRDLTP